jgi:hypothetical protein
VTTPPRLHPDDVAAIADLVADLVAERLRDTSSHALVDAQTIARRFGLGPRWVRDHAAELRAVRVGGGPKPRLRFDVEKVAAALTARSSSKESQAPDRPARRRWRRVQAPSTLDGFPLLPVRGPEPGPVSTTELWISEQEKKA